MVCVYCGGLTKVINSRPQRRQNSVWRRRQCQRCHAIVSSTERVVYADVFAVRDATSHIVPFQRDILFLDIYDACRHRQAPSSNAAALTDTVLSKLLASRRFTGGIIDRNAIVEVTSVTLKLFDAAAYTHYLAFHPLQR